MSNEGEMISGILTISCLIFLLQHFSLIFVILNKYGNIMFDNVAKRPVQSEGNNTDSLLVLGKAHMQVLVTDFAER